VFWVVYAPARDSEGIGYRPERRFASGECDSSSSPRFVLLGGRDALILFRRDWDSGNGTGSVFCFPVEGSVT